MPNPSSSLIFRLVDVSFMGSAWEPNRSTWGDFRASERRDHLTRASSMKYCALPTNTNETFLLFLGLKASKTCVNCFLGLSFEQGFTRSRTQHFITKINTRPTRLFRARLVFANSKANKAKPPQTPRINSMPSIHTNNVVPVRHINLHQHAWNSSPSPNPAENRMVRHPELAVAAHTRPSCSSTDVSL